MSHVRALSLIHPQILAPLVGLAPANILDENQVTLALTVRCSIAELTRNRWKSVGSPLESRTPLRSMKSYCPTARRMGHQGNHKSCSLINLLAENHESRYKWLRLVDSNHHQPLQKAFTVLETAGLTIIPRRNIESKLHLPLPLKSARSACLLNNLEGRDAFAQHQFQLCICLFLSALLLLWRPASYVCMLVPLLAKHLFYFAKTKDFSNEASKGVTPAAYAAASCLVPVFKELLL